MAFTLPPLFFFFSFSFLFTKFFFMVCCSFSRAPFSPDCCLFWRFFGLFCPVLLLGGVLALCRAPISSNWFFVWHSLGPSSTQLLVHNHSGFCSHRYLAGLIFLWNTSFYRLCSSLPPCFSFDLNKILFKEVRKVRRSIV